MSEVETWIENEVARLGNPTDSVRGARRSLAQGDDAVRRGARLVAARTSSSTGCCAPGAVRSACSSGSTGLTVRAPRWVTSARIEAALREHGPMGRAEARGVAEARRIVPSAAGRQGADRVPGRRAHARIVPGTATGNRGPICCHLTVLHPTPDDEARNRSFCRTLAARRQRCASSTPRVADLAAAVTASSPSGRSCRMHGAQWGSCNRKGEIRAQLAARPAAATSSPHYVVAHEVAHLVELESFAAVLGAGRDADPRPCRCASRARRSGRAAWVRHVAWRTHGGAQPAPAASPSRPDCSVSRAASRWASDAPDSCRPACRAMRLRAREMEAAARAATQISRFGCAG